MDISFSRRHQLFDEHCFFLRISSRRRLQIEVQAERLSCHRFFFGKIVATAAAEQTKILALFPAAAAVSKRKN